MALYLAGDKKRLEKVVQEAELAFWAKVAEMYPEVKTGDLDPQAAMHLTCVMEAVARLWLECNAPKSGDRKCHECGSEIGEGEWSFDFSKEIGGPNDGCSEWASDEMACHVCASCMDKERPGDINPFSEGNYE